VFRQHLAEPGLFRCFGQINGGKMKNLTAVFRLIVLVTVLFPAGARGDDTVIELRFENRRFTPQTITVPANQSLTLRITNASKEPIEFESFQLNREKVVGPGETIIVRLPALRPGSYDFYDDFHQDVPAGSIVAK
jgi:Cupredoxin-like domain